MSDNDNDTVAEEEAPAPTCLTISLQQDRVVVPLRLPTEQVQAVTIAIADNFQTLTEHGIQTLETILAAHTNLQYINIERLTHAVTSISVPALIRILQLPNLSTLTDLRILGANLLGTRDEWQQLAHTVLRNHLRLLEFICIVEPLAWLSRIPEQALDPLVRVCATHSTLKFVATNLFSGVSLEAIDDFCHSPQIMGLHLVDTDVSGDRVFRFLEQMQHNRKIWFLSIAFAQTVTTDHGKAIAQLLKHNQAIANLSIKSKQTLQEEFVRQVVQGLAYGPPKLEEFSLEGSSSSSTDGTSLVLSDSCRAAMGSMLEANKVLRKLQFEGIQSETLKEEIQIYMKLNRAGRRHLMMNAQQRQHATGTTTTTTRIPPTSNKVWLDALSHDATRDDLNCVYYLLSKNPEVIYCGQTTQTQPNQQQQRRQQQEGAKVSLQKETPQQEQAELKSRKRKAQEISSSSLSSGTR